jgi:hypothetical protein
MIREDSQKEPMNHPTLILWHSTESYVPEHLEAASHIFEALMCKSCQDRPVGVRLISTSSAPSPPSLTGVFDPQRESIRSVKYQRSTAYSGWRTVVQISTGLPTTRTRVYVGLLDCNELQTSALNM